MDAHVFFLIDSSLLPNRHRQFNTARMGRRQGGDQPLAAAPAPAPDAAKPVTTQRQRLLAAMSAMEAALAADDASRAARAAGGADEEADAGLGSYYDAAAAVPAGLIYPEGGWWRGWVWVVGVSDVRGMECMPDE